MTNKLYFRCLVEDAESPSGYRIVGHLKFHTGDWSAMAVDNNISHSHIERGIEIDGVVYYEGDRVASEHGPHGYIKVMDNGAFVINIDGTTSFNWRLTGATKIIGTIHDKGECDVYFAGSNNSGGAVFSTTRGRI